MNLKFSLYIGGEVRQFSSILIWLVVLRIYVALAVFQPYRDLEAGDNQSLKFKWRGGESNPGPLAPQAKSLTTRPPPLLFASWRRRVATSPILFFLENGWKWCILRLNFPVDCVFVLPLLFVAIEVLIWWVFDLGVFFYIWGGGQSKREVDRESGRWGSGGGDLPQCPIPHIERDSAGSSGYGDSQICLFLFLRKNFF